MNKHILIITQSRILTKWWAFITIVFATVFILVRYAFGLVCYYCLAYRLGCCLDCLFVCYCPWALLSLPPWALLLRYRGPPCFTLLFAPMFIIDSRKQLTIELLSSNDVKVYPSSFGEIKASCLKSSPSVFAQFCFNCCIREQFHPPVQAYKHAVFHF